MAKPGPKRDTDAQWRILHATRELIAERGPGSVTIDEIAAEAGVGKQTIYRWWRSRSELVLDALETVVKAALPRESGPSVASEVSAELRRVALFFASPRGSLVRELVADAQAEPGLAGQLDTRILGPIKARLAVLVRRGVDRGVVRSDLDPELAADLLLAPLLTRLVLGHLPITLETVDGFFDLTWPALAVQAEA